MITPDKNWEKIKRQSISDKDREMMQDYNPKTHEPCRSAPHSGQDEMTVNGFTFLADKDLVPLLKELNAAGIQTYSHCAGHTPQAPAWIVLEAENLNIEIRQHLGRSQIVLSWSIEGDSK